jgi:hypothetical protein
MKNILVQLSIGATRLVAALFLCGGVQAGAESLDRAGVTAVFALPGQSQVAAFNPAQGRLGLFTVRQADLHEEVAATVEGSVQQVTRSPQGVLVATGAGKDAQSAPLRVVLLSEQLQQPRTVFEAPTERAEVTQLSWREGRLWITFFDSKYTTKTGSLTPTPQGAWRFTEVVSLRLGTAVDQRGDTVVIGRPYGDTQGDDGDLLLVRAGARQLLPSYRGVRAVRFLGALADSLIVIADGWHQNYGKVAQGRISLLARDEKSGRYALQLIDRDETQHSFSKLLDFNLGQQQHVAALGPTRLNVYGPGPAWPKKVAYSRDTEDSMMDLAVVQTEPNRVALVVVDKGVRVVMYP